MRGRASVDAESEAEEEEEDGDGETGKQQKLVVQKNART